MVDFYKIQHPTDTEERVRRKILEALHNKQYKARTITGIAAETKLTARSIVNAIKKDQMLTGAVKIYPIRAKDGRVLITTKARFAEEATKKEKFVDFFASNRLSLDGTGVEIAE